MQELRDKIKIRDEAEKGEALRKAQKRLVQAINKARNLLKSQGIQARKDEKARLERLKEYAAKDELPPLEDLVPFREPDKNPTDLEKMRCTEDFYPKLVQQIRELQSYQQLQDQEDDVVFKVGPSQERENVLDYLDLSPPPPNLVDSSDVESDAGSIDSI